MLKVLSSSVLFGRKLQTLPSRIPQNGEVRYPLHRFFESLRGLNGKRLLEFRKVWFCSESGDGLDKVVELKAAEDAAEGGGGDEAVEKANSAIVLTSPRPEDHLTVIALPLPHKPLFPGFYMPLYVKADTGRNSLGLTLYKTPEFLERIEASVDEEDERYTKIRKYTSQPDSEKLKACNFPARKIQIGNWERTASNDNDIVVKIYFNKKQIVWEVLVDKMKKKIEISWNNISSLRAMFAEGKPSTLHIELNLPPNFFDEFDPQPRRHPAWMTTQDFTGGEALRCRRHTLTFSEGILEKHYEKFVHSNGWLFHKHRGPFPVHNSTLFEVVQRSDTLLNHQQYAFNPTYERAIPAQQPILMVPHLGPPELPHQHPFPRPVMGNIDLSSQAMHYAHHNMAMDSMPPGSVNRGHDVPVRTHSNLIPNIYSRRVRIDPRTQYCARNQTLHANAIPAGSSLSEGFYMSNYGECNLCGSSPLMSTGAYNQNEAHGNHMGEGISLRNSTDFSHADRLLGDFFLMNDDDHNLDIGDTSVGVQIDQETNTKLD